MAFHSKVKNFTQNTFFFSLGLVIMMLFYEIGYSRYESLANTQENETQANTLGSTVTALGMNIGLQKHIADTTPVNLINSTIDVTPTLSDPQIGEKSFLTENMKFLEAYTELLSTDIPSLLDQATDRTTAIDAYRNLLLEYQTLGQDHIDRLKELQSEYQTTESEITTRGQAAYANFQTAYENVDTISVHTYLEEYLTAKNDDARVQTYLSLISRFGKRYETLQSVNANLIEVISLNREALIKGVTVTIPNNNTTLLENLDLLNNQ